MGIGTKIKQVLSDEPHGKDKLPGSYPDESSRTGDRQDYDTPSRATRAGTGGGAGGAGTGAVPAAAAGTGVGAAGAGAGGLAAGKYGAGDRLHKRDDPRGTTDTYDRGAGGGVPTRSNGGAVGGATPATRGAPAVGSTPAYDESAMPASGASQGRDYGKAPGPIAFGPGSSRPGAAGTGTGMGAGPGMGAGHPAGNIPGQESELAPRQAVPSSHNGNSRAGMGAAGAGAGLAAAGGAAGLQQRGVGHSGGSSGYDSTTAPNARMAEPQTGTTQGRTIPLGGAGGTTTGPDGIGNGQYSNTAGSVNPHNGEVQSGPGAGVAAGAVGARDSHPHSGPGSKKDYYGPGHEGATVVHKCDSCGADNDISRYFDKGTIYRMED